MFGDNQQFVQVSASDTAKLAEIKLFLRENGLTADAGVSVFLTAWRNGRLIACGGLDKNIIKCVAIDESLRGEGIALELVTELIKLAYDHDETDLFIFTKPENEVLFKQCGFFPLADVPGLMVLMENSPSRLPRYVRALMETRHEGHKIGCIVMNANPFTNGHLYLIEQAAARCDWLHIFPVKEDASVFPYADRLAMIKAGTEHIAKLTVHEGSEYIISRATFPSYFLKDSQLADRCHMELDAKIFRRYIAPALGVTHRFVGTEPLCPVTAEYNRALEHWLKTRELLPAQPIELVTLPRLCGADGAPISASNIRSLLKAGDFESVKPLVPPSTLAYLQKMQEENRLSEILSHPRSALSPSA